MEYEGFRAWDINSEGRLTSVSSDFVWSETTMRATCRHGCDIGFCIREHNCTCGFYSRKKLESLLIDFYRSAVYGAIINHGTVLEADVGFRSEYATIKTLWAPKVYLTILRKNYPGVEVLPRLDKNFFRIPKPSSRVANRAKLASQKQAKLLGDKELWPEGPEAEQKRLLGLLQNASREEIVAFTKEYTSSPDWLSRNWLYRAENSKKAKPGDMVFEANNTLIPYVFIGSVRSSESFSMRWLFTYNGYIVRRANIRKWDEEPELLEARKKAISEWR